MRDSDFYAIMLLILGLCGVTLLQSRAIRQVDMDVQFLLDHAVTRETERRPT